MDMMTLLVAAVAAAAIFLIAIGIATSGGGSGVSARLERYASARESGKGAETSGQGGIAELLEKSVALAQLNRVVEQRDFGANLARDIARADLKLKPSEFLAIWGAAIVGIPILFVFEQTGVTEGKIQGRLKPTGIRPKFVEKFEVMGIHLPPGLFGFSY